MNTLSEELEKVMEWRTKIYKGVSIEFTSHGYRVFGRLVNSLSEAHEVIDESFLTVQNSIKK